MHHPLAGTHGVGVILGNVQMIHRLGARHHLPTRQPVTVPTVPSAFSTRIPSLIWPTGRNPFSIVKKGCHWLV